VSFQQSIDDYVESFHSMNGFSRERMTEEATHGFDSEVRELVSKYCPDRRDGIAECRKGRLGQPHNEMSQAMKGKTILDSEYKGCFSSASHLQ